MDLPDQYVHLREDYADFMEALDALGKAASAQGPLDEKTAQLIQMAAGVAIRSEGAVHSHARRAIQAGCTPQEVKHAVFLLTSTVGFPNVSAALSWVDDILLDR